MDSGYCFPPPSQQPRQRARSFNAPVRPADGPRRTHAHRRSAAVSEDLSGVDFSQYMEPKSKPSGQYLEPQSPFRFGAPSGAPSAVASGAALSASAPQASTLSAAVPLSLNHLNSSESSLASSASAAGSTNSHLPRVSFVEPRSPQRSVRSLHRSELLAPQISIPSLRLDDGSTQTAQPPSPTGSGKHSRRRSLLNLFRKKDSAPSAASSGPTSSANSATSTASTTSNSASNSASTSPVEVVPTVTPPMYEEPEPPQISLDEARGCGHRRAESLPMAMDSSFSPYKRASFIGPVVEEKEEDEEEADVTVRPGDRSRHTVRECPSSDSCASVSQLAILEPPLSLHMPLQASSPTSLSSSASSQSMLSNPSLLYSPRQEMPKLKPFALGEPGSLAPPSLAPASPASPTQRSHRRRRSLAALFGRQ